jgi:hypothetical protein
MCFNQLGMQVQFYPTYDDAEDNLKLPIYRTLNIQQYVQTLELELPILLQVVLDFFS